MLGVPQVAGIRYHDTADGAKPPGDFLCLGEASHMGIAGGEIAVRRREPRIVLDRQEQFRHGLLEPPSQEMRLAYQRKRSADAGARAEPQRGFGMLDREVGVARKKPENAADMPTPCKIWVQRKGTIDQRNHCADILADSKPTQLHYGRLPVHPRFWSYDANRGILSYNFKSDGVDHVGSLTFVHAASSAIGTLSVDNQHVGVQAVLARVSYSCDVALDTGASVTGVAPALSLHWDASDPKWSSAIWIKDALTLHPGR
jgi:hypothetical protein